MQFLLDTHILSNLVKRLPVAVAARIAARKTRDDKSIPHQKYYIQKNYLLQLCNTTLKKLHEE
jgi:hypothetical protein